jgi:hypothetical protein
MRYISPFEDLALYRNDGTIAHKFKNGELICGDRATRDGTNLSADALPYTVDYYAYVSAPETEIQQSFESVIGVRESEAAWQRLEKIGLGYLNGFGYDGATALDSLPDGYRGSFYEAPDIATGATTVPATAGIKYEVTAATVTYDGVAYTLGQVFTSDGTTTTTSGAGGKFAIVLPWALKNVADQMEPEAFALMHLGTPEDMIAYWNKLNGGYTPTNSMTTTDVNFIGRMR